MHKDKIAPRLFLLLVLLSFVACVRAATSLTYPPPLRAGRVVYLIPFSHWDTDWHADYSDYAKRADNNIANAIILAKQDARFRYTMEQPLFVQHFWQSHPAARADLKRLVQNGQLTFAWAGLTQPETSLVAPAIQVRNLQIGRQWIAETFGPEFIPNTAWQSDAFGNSAAFPLFLQQMKIPYLYVGRWQAKCDPQYEDCTPLPHAFYWRTPASDARVLVAYLAYPAAWAAIYRLKSTAEQVVALRKVVDGELARTHSKYLFIPLGFDFYSPQKNLMELVDAWNASDPEVTLTVADPATAFAALATQNLPEFNVDFNPIWQAFYGTRPEAKIADKESEYLLTANDKFSLLSGQPPLQSTAWFTAAMNAHYDNIGAVSFDQVWESTQRPRFAATVQTAADDLAQTLATIASGVDAPLLLFNPTSWPRAEVVELTGAAANMLTLPAPLQQLGDQHVAFFASPIPALGYAAPAANTNPLPQPVQVTQNGKQITLSNGLVQVTLDGQRGGGFTSLTRVGGPELLAETGDDLTYIGDEGDVYGARFGEVQAQASQSQAQLTVLAAGPLLARVQAVLTLGGQPVTKTVTLYAASPRVEVMLNLRALPQTSAVLQIPTTLAATERTDDLGFTALTHAVDNRPIVPGDITYRREIFYPIMYWSDVTAARAGAGSEGLALITHGLQGLGGMGRLNLLVVRWASNDKDGEGVTDPDYHVVRYAYLPHQGETGETMRVLVQAAYAFNQPLIPVWRSGQTVQIQLPFAQPLRTLPSVPLAMPLPVTLAVAAGLDNNQTDSSVVADLYRVGGDKSGAIKSVTIDYQAEK